MEYSEPDPRFALAAERTLLAWIRTGVAMMGFGFVVARFGLFLREMAAVGHAPAMTIPTTGASLWIGVALVVVGALVNIVAAVEYHHFLRDLRSGRSRQPRTWSFAVFVGALLALIGLVMAGYLLVINQETVAPPAAATLRACELATG